MVWLVRILVVGVFTLDGPLVSLPHRSLIANLLIGLFTGLFVVLVASYIGADCKWLRAKWPRGAKRAGIVFYLIGWAMAGLAVGLAVYSGYVGIGRKLIVLCASSSVLYWAAGWGLYRSLTYGAPTPVARKYVETADVRPLGTNGVSASKLLAFTNRRQKKIALSLAIVGALASPFVFHTYVARPSSAVWMPLTPQQKESLAVSLQKSNYCQREIGVVDGYLCNHDKEVFELGGDYEYHPDLLKYLALNVGAMTATFIGVFVLALLIPMLARAFAFLSRRYWKWLNG